MKNNKPTNKALNIKLLKENWKKKNIELCPIKENKLWRYCFKFISEDVTIRATDLCKGDNIVVWYNCASFVADYLLQNGYITKIDFDNYSKELQNLFFNQCYS